MVENILANVALACHLTRHRKEIGKVYYFYGTDGEIEAGKVTQVAQDHRAGQGKHSDTAHNTN